MCWNTSLCELLVESMQPRVERRWEQSPLSAFQIPTKKSLMIFMFSICHDKTIPLTMWWNIFLKWKRMIIFFFYSYLKRNLTCYAESISIDLTLWKPPSVFWKNQVICDQTRNKFSMWHVLKDVWPCPYQVQVLLKFYLHYHVLCYRSMELNVYFRVNTCNEHMNRKK